MKLIVLIFTLLSVSFSFSAESNQVICKDSTSELIIQKSNGAYDVEGTYRYNLSSNGEYGSLIVFGCKAAARSQYVILDCINTTYSVYFSLFQIPKNIFSKPNGYHFSTLEKRRDENSNQVLSTYKYRNCELAPFTQLWQ